VDITEAGSNWRYGSIIQGLQVFRERLLNGAITGVDRVANSVFLNTDTGYALALGYLSGRVTYHPPGQDAPAKSCLRLRFADGSGLSVVVSLWGLVRALNDDERAAYVSRWYGRAIEPLSERYTWDGFQGAVAQVEDAKLSATKFLHAFEPGYYVSGLDSGYAIEILHRAGIHPKRKLASLSLDEQRACYDGVNTVAREASDQGGRYSEVGLYGQVGRYVPHVCRARLGQPCLECGTAIEKLRFEGGACYVCPHCQPL
jgi:formamidopyrimidine-DNA glycosylase